jgi:hypothetical protein
MKKDFTRRIILCAVILLAYFAGTNPVFAIPSSPAKGVVSGNYYYQQPATPNAELELTHIHAPTGIHSAVHKLSAPSFLSYPAIYHFYPNLIIASRIRQSSLLVKDYLFHIYPSHHFW